MIVPTVEDLLLNISATFEEIIRPALIGTPERSAAATLSHLLRLARLRVAEEGQILTDDIAALRGLLPQIHTYLASINEDATPITQALATPGPEAYPSLTHLGREAATLREALSQALIHLQSLRPTQGETEPYQKIRTAIRAYMTHQIAEESRLIDPAFAGHGPRR